MHSPQLFTNLNLVANTGANQKQTAAISFLPGVAQVSFKPTDHAVLRFELMVPLLPTLRRLARLGALLSLLISLSGCVSFNQPPRQALLSALNLQVQLSEVELADALQLSPRKDVPSLQRVRLDQQRLERIQNQKVWLLHGRFDWRWPGEALNVASPFELRLIRGEKGQTWRLLKPPSSQSPQWRIYPLPLA